MSRVDWDEMVAQLTGQRETVAQELEDIDAVIATVRARAALPEPSSQPRTSKPKPAAAKTNGKPPRASSADTDKAKARARKMWEHGDDVKLIAKVTGRSVGSVYSWSSEGKWKRPNPGVAASPAAAAPTPTPAGHQLSGSVRCSNPECEAWTDYDPCRTCGKPLKRKW